MAYNAIKVDTEVIPVQAGTTLLSTHWLPGENIVAEFVEEPDCGIFNWCQNGSIRKIQLMTHRLFFVQATRTWCCLKKVKKPVMRQVFIQNIAEVSIGDYSDVQTTFKVLKTFLGLVLIIGGLVLVFQESATYYYDDYYGRGNDNSSTKVAGYVLIIVGILVLILSFCLSTIPHMIFGTRCPQVGLFSIKLRKAEGRVRLLEHVSTLIYAHYKK